MENDINEPTIDINIDLDELAKNFDIWFEKTVKGKKCDKDIYNLMRVFFSFCEPNINCELNTEKTLSEKNNNLISFKKYIKKGIK